MYLLDTNICVALLKQNILAVEQFNAKASLCYLPTIVVAELYKGVYCSQRVQQNLTMLEQFLNLMPIVEFDRSAAEEFGKIQAELRSMGRPTGEIDAIIAAIARSRQDILVTDNTRHFINISGLQQENWLEP
ncbi:MAG: tRNA(fMet)-specific endonuclease VapC [Chroococcidiopsis sp. SAG 2025]|uniref:type II toxin-antitoxin system VapC family toxin n=1 Tax=Chroococcidiopsis sp. SAG 2025 TaxID=171389 RepID=UPI002937428C|nr:type II toxin-antitoxin system VapC family toxin [Chroococcidiopsis sp. SAG 2025]MDV2992084.1 tRNA(fMet)-specific endonuclease VapC [Chroococcidiopsis sp. SAG 2025]